MNDTILSDLQSECEKLSLTDGLKFVADAFKNEVIFSTSFGLEDQAITYAISKSGANIHIFTLDTGRLFNETYELYAKTVLRYKLNIVPYYP